MKKTASLITIAGIALAAACHSSPPPVTATPEPQPTAKEIALQKQVRDSLLAMSHTADSIEVARLDAARADSVERARLAAAAREATDEAAEKSTELRDELGVMVHFDVAKAQLGSDDRAVLDRKVAILNANPNVRLRITGACDERGSDEYNMALGNRRAAAVKLYLNQKGINVSRLDVASFGEESPIDSGNNETAWVRNRRAEFAIVSGDTPLAMK